MPHNVAEVRYVVERVTDIDAGADSGDWVKAPYVSSVVVHHTV